MTPMKHPCLWMSKTAARPVTCWCRPTVTAFSMFSTAPMANFSAQHPSCRNLNWATGVDASGRPVLSGRIPTEQGTYICPGINGATNWFSPSYNPDTGLFYVMALENCNLFFSKSEAVYAAVRPTTVRARNFRPMNTRRKFCWRTPCRRENQFGVIRKSGRAIPGEGR